MPATPYEPMKTALGTKRFTETDGLIDVVNNNADKRHWYSGNTAPKTSTYTVTSTDELILTDTATGGAFQIDLPAAADVLNRLVPRAVFIGS